MLHSWGKVGLRSPAEPNHSLRLLRRGTLEAHDEGEAEPSKAVSSIVNRLFKQRVITEEPNTMTHLYDAIGSTYQDYRRPDARIATVIAWTLLYGFHLMSIH